MTFSRTLRYFLLTTAFILSLTRSARAELTNNQAALQFSAFAKQSCVTTYTSPDSVTGAAMTRVTPVSAPVYNVHVSAGNGAGALSQEIPTRSNINELVRPQLNNLPHTCGEVDTIESYQIFIPLILRSGNPSPLSWWKGDGDASDSVGEHDGTLFGEVSFVTGVSGSAFYLDGENDYVEIPHHPELNPEIDSFSVLVWVRPEQAPWSRIIMKGNLDPSDYYISIDPGVAFVSEIGGLSDRTMTYYQNVPSEQWYHLALVRDRSLNLVKLYVNGSLAQASQVAIDVTGGISNESPLVLGKNATAPAEYFKGSIDEVKYYNYEVTPEQILDEIISAYPQVISIDRVLTAVKSTPPAWISPSLSQRRWAVWWWIL